MFIWWVLLVTRYTFGSLLLAVFLPFSSFLKKRRNFEKEWGLERLNEVAFDVWFHVSSEGELEQIMPWVEENYKVGKKQLILFTSPSLVNRANHLHSPEDNIFFACFSLTSFYPQIFKLPLPNEFFMVRYDFFPELLWVARKVSQSTLLAGTLKGKREKLKRPFFRFWSSMIFQSFHRIFTSTVKDKGDFEDLLKGRGVQIEDLDFRHGQILKRQNQKEQLQAQDLFYEIENHILKFPIQKRLIFGSLWPLELEVFTDDFFKFIKNEEILLFIAPHHLKGENWQLIEAFLPEFENHQLKTFLWNKSSTPKRLEGAQIILCQIPGLLCEIYPYFGHCFIGGGHGRSIHSLLEPYWGGGHLYFGPKTHRSTEFDFVQDESPKQQHIVRELGKFYHIFKRNLAAPVDRDHREKLALVLNKKQQQVF